MIPWLQSKNNPQDQATTDSVMSTCVTTAEYTKLHKHKLVAALTFLIFFNMENGLLIDAVERLKSQAISVTPKRSRETTVVGLYSLW